MRLLLEAWCPLKPTILKPVVQMFHATVPYSLSIQTKEIKNNGSGKGLKGEIA